MIGERKLFLLEPTFRGLLLDSIRAFETQNPGVLISLDKAYRNLHSTRMFVPKVYVEGEPVPAKYNDTMHHPPRSYGMISYFPSFGAEVSLAVRGRGKIPYSKHDPHWQLWGEWAMHALDQGLRTGLVGNGERIQPHVVEMPLKLAEEVVVSLIQVGKRTGSAHSGVKRAIDDKWLADEMTYLGKFYSVNVGRPIPVNGLMIHPDVWTLVWKRYTYETFKM